MVVVFDMCENSTTPSIMQTHCQNHRNPGIVQRQSYRCSKPGMMHSSEILISTSQCLKHPLSPSSTKTPHKKTSTVNDSHPATKPRTTYLDKKCRRRFRPGRCTLTRAKAGSQASFSSVSFVLGGGVSHLIKTAGERRGEGPSSTSVSSSL